MRTGTLCDRAVAWALVLAWHLLAVRWLLHAVPVPQRTRDEPPFEVIYVTRPPPAVASPPASTTTAVRARTSVRDRRLPPARPASGALTVVDHPSAASLIAQASAAAAPAAPADPFARPAPRLPGEGPGRFRMRNPITPARVVAWLGSHVLAPRGYNADPCPRNRANIGNLMGGQDPSALQQELDFQRQHCLP